MEIRTANITDIDKIMALRLEVFVLEQGVPHELELDSADRSAIHIIAELDGEAVGCARMITENGDAHIGRLAVKREKRGEGIGSAVCSYAISAAEKLGSRLVWINAQLHAKSFYERLGFCAVGDVFYEAGIKHIRMELEL